MSAIIYMRNQTAKHKKPLARTIDMYSIHVFSTPKGMKLSALEYHSSGKVDFQLNYNMEINFNV